VGAPFPLAPPAAFGARAAARGGVFGGPVALPPRREPPRAGARPTRAPSGARRVRRRPARPPLEAGRPRKRVAVLPALPAPPFRLRPELRRAARGARDHRTRLRDRAPARHGLVGFRGRPDAEEKADAGASARVGLVEELAARLQRAPRGTRRRAPRPRRDLGLRIPQRARGVAARGSAREGQFPVLDDPARHGFAAGEVTV